MTGPREIGAREGGFVRSNFQGRRTDIDAGYHGGDVASLLDRGAPVVRLVGIDGAEIVFDNVGEIAAPAVAAIVGVQTVANGLIRGALHGNVERSVNAQALFVNGGGAVGALQILPKLLDEVGREIVALRRQV